MDQTGSPWRAVGGARLLALTLILCTCPAVPGRAAPPRDYEPVDLKALERAFTKLAEEVRPSVVAIRTYIGPNQNNRRGRTVTIPNSQGSGFVIDPEGYIATNHHVIADADTISVILHNGEQRYATVQQVDVRSDLAVIKIDAEGLKPVRWSDQSALEVGQWAFACGNPFGLANRDGRISVSVGVVSALGRNMTDRLDANQQMHYYGNLIETSAAINPGNSGGPLFDIDGRLIGVVTAIETSSGVSEGTGFAIPIDKNIRRILETLKTGQVYRYGYMGVEINDVPPPQSRRVADSRIHRGARIRALAPPDGPAAKAELRTNDIVIEVDGTPVEDTDHLVRLIQFAPVGSEVEITYLRKNVKRKTKITLGDRAELVNSAPRE
jgi:serine protease Do